jgi:hypothetical protein
MWKLKCIYEDGGRVTITGKDKAITKELYSKYMTLYGITLIKPCISNIQRGNTEKSI